MTSVRVLVIGGSGMLGAPVVEALLRRGNPVRLLARDVGAMRARFPQAETVGGDVLDPPSLAAAMRDCGGVHVSLRGRSIAEIERVEVQGVRNIAQAAARGGVGRLTYLSGAGLREEHRRDPFVAAKLQAEAEIRTSGAPFTLFRATHFMESLPMFVHGGRADVIGRQPHRFHYLAARDYAAMVAASFETPAAQGESLDVFGPEAFTMGDALAVYLEACGIDARPGVLPIPMARIIGTLRPATGLAHAARLFASFQKLGEFGDPARVNALFGPPTTTLALWCEARRAHEG